MADFARLGFTDGEVKRMRAEPGAIGEGMERVRKLNRREGPPRANPLRPDEPASCLTQEEALRNAPEKADGYFVVPRLDG
jgi:aspartyl-tRNA(Asn)/glutamyl-tRNA(Gln) amidotransferase subunit C